MWFGQVISILETIKYTKRDKQKCKMQI